jgi:hypothetical protein
MDDAPGDRFIRDADHGFGAGGDVGPVGEAEHVGPAELPDAASGGDDHDLGEQLLDDDDVGHRDAADLSAGSARAQAHAVGDQGWLRPRDPGLVPCLPSSGQQAQSIGWPAGPAQGPVPRISSAAAPAWPDNGAMPQRSADGGRELSSDAAQAAQEKSLGALVGTFPLQERGLTKFKDTGHLVHCFAQGFVDAPPTGVAPPAAMRYDDISWVRQSYLEHYINHYYNRTSFRITIGSVADEVVDWEGSFSDRPGGPGSKGDPRLPTFGRQLAEKVAEARWRSITARRSSSAPGSASLTPERETSTRSGSLFRTGAGFTVASRLLPAWRAGPAQPIWCMMPAPMIMRPPALSRLSSHGRSHLRHRRADGTVTEESSSGSSGRGRARTARGIGR